MVGLAHCRHSAGPMSELQLHEQPMKKLSTFVFSQAAS